MPRYSSVMNKGKKNDNEIQLQRPDHQELRHQEAHAKGVLPIDGREGRDHPHDAEHLGGSHEACSWVGRQEQARRHGNIREPAIQTGRKQHCRGRAAKHIRELVLSAKRQDCADKIRHVQGGRRRPDAIVLIAKKRKRTWRN